MNVWKADIGISACTAQQPHQSGESREKEAHPSRTSRKGCLSSIISRIFRKEDPSKLLERTAY